MLLDKNNRSAEQLRAEHVRNVEYLRCMQEDAFLNERMIEVDDRTNRNFNESVDIAEILDIDKHLGYPKDDCKSTEIDAIMKAAKNISLDDIMGVGAACGPSYESTLIFEQAFIEGANLDMIDVCKRATKEYKKQMKSIKAHIKDKKYSLAIRELDELDKSFKTFQNEFKMVDSETVSTTILGYILRSVINACQTILASLITLPIGGVGGAIVVIKFNIENIIGFFKELLKELKDEDDINVKLFNKNRSTILVRMDSMSKQISKMKEAIAEIEKQEKEVKESADEVVTEGSNSDIMELYREHTKKAKENLKEANKLIKKQEFAEAKKLLNEVIDDMKECQKILRENAEDDTSTEKILGSFIAYWRTNASLLVTILGTLAGLAIALIPAAEIAGFALSYTFMFGGTIGSCIAASYEETKVSDGIYKMTEKKDPKSNQDLSAELIKATRKQGNPYRALNYQLCDETIIAANRLIKKIDKLESAIKKAEAKQEKEVKESTDEVVVVGKADPIVASNEVEKNPTTVTTEPVDGKKDHDNDETFGQVEPAKGQKFENAADDEGNFEDIDDALKFFDDDYNKSDADNDRDGQRDLEVDVIDKDEVPVLTKANVEETADCEDPSGVKEDNENLEKDAFSFFGLDDIDKNDDGIPDNQDDAEDLPENNKVSFDDAKKMIEFDGDEDNSAMKDVPKLNDPEEKAEEMIQKSAYESFDEFKKLLQF